MPRTSASTDPQTRARTSIVAWMQVWFLKFFVILPMRALPFVAQLWCLWRLRRTIASWRHAGHSAGVIAAAVVRSAAAVWLPLEAAHGIFYFVRKAELQVPLERVELATAQQRRDMMRRWLESVEDIHSASASGGLVMRQSTSMTELLGRQASPMHLQNPRKAMAAATSTKPQRATSVEHLLRAPADAADRARANLAVFKDVELRSFFFGCECARDIGALDFEDIISHWFFHGAAPEELDADCRLEVASLVRVLVGWARLPPPRPGRNPQMTAILPSRDPLYARPRPLAIYMVTGCAGLLDDMVLYCIGFRRYELGGFIYYRLPGHGMSAVPRIDACDEKRTTLPIVFLHGLGMGVMTYLPLIRDLAGLGEEVFFVVLQPLFMRPFTHLPTPAQLAQMMQDILGVWGHTRAHFLGHSFGTIACAWVVHHAPSIVAMLTLADPVCFFSEKCAIKLIAHFQLSVGAKHRDIGQMTVLDEVVKYLALQELEITRVAQRASVTPANCLWPEQLRETPMLVLLGSRDSICPAHMVRHLLAAELSRRAENTAPISVLWVEGQIHGSFLFQPRVARDFLGMISRMHVHGQMWHAGKLAEL
eukprot:NODE_2739_length_2155_cov_13.394477.p1 GENE.NODE_2739_length_2155_cov_13.394477~~NODE_2739_length_2155_cov_13.394477.p1  ORF type:complete len:593 (-),score=113.74 NODE_2739_length_2155_cov_13.394477:314-2092(-)